MPERQPDLLKEQAPGPRLAIVAEALFLANLMVAPGIAFVAMFVLWRRHRAHPDPLVRNHLEQTVFASLWGGAFLVGMSLVIFLLGGFESPAAWVLAILYFVCFHATLILLGVIGLNRAILAQRWRYPLIGPELEE